VHSPGLRLGLLVGRSNPGSDPTCRIEPDGRLYAAQGAPARSFLPSEISLFLSSASSRQVQNRPLMQLSIPLRVSLRSPQRRA
jgi:hypothetical protein